MATATANIIVGGKKIDSYHVSLNQRFDQHHYFEIAVSSEKVESKNSINIDKSVEYIGKSAEINISCAGNDLVFKGIITHIHLGRTYTGDSVIVFVGYSPTYLMEDGAATKSFEEKDLSVIANELMGEYPGNLLSPVVSPKYSTPIPYVVQYKETNYQFLSRMAAKYGEWFFYDGQAVVFGELPNPASVELMLGKDLDSFDYGVNVRPSKFKYQFYKYEENRLMENSTAGFKPSWLDKYGKKGLDVSDSIFPSEPVNPIWEHSEDDAVLKHLAEARKSSILGDTSFFAGQSQNTAITVGGRIGASAMNKVGNVNVPAIIGRFRVIAVRHELNANKDYTNQFEAVPISVTAPPVNKNVFKPEAESQVAVVKENNDPGGLGRIRVQFKWQTGDEMTPWIRQITNYASGDRGTYFVPELEDEVYVGFDQGNPDRAYMQGALYHSNTPPEFFDPENNLKSIKTRSGHTILMDDKDGSESIIIKDKNGNTIHLDTAGSSITISAPDTITLSSKKINIEASEKVKISGTNNVDIESMEIKAAGSSKVEITSPVEVDVNALTTKVSGTTKLELKSDLQLEASAMMTDIKGEAMTNVSGSMTTVKGNATLKLNC